jgi:hypothetical protein
MSSADRNLTPVTGKEWRAKEVLVLKVESLAVLHGAMKCGRAGS